MLMVAKCRNAIRLHFIFETYSAAKIVSGGNVTVLKLL
jgi:hypothetical protein